MLEYIHKALNVFRPAFSRTATWVMFCMVVLGFMGAADMVGVSSFCRFWNLGEHGYNSLLHFFRSTAWSFELLVFYWGAFVLSQNETIKIEGRAILLGDHTYVPKDGRRMPGVISLRQQSETQSKPSYFRGHCWGAIGLLIGTLELSFCLPLSLGLHLGFIHLGQKNPKNEIKDTMGARLVQMAVDFAVSHNLPSILILDAFFPTAAVFKLAASVWSINLRQPLVTLIVNAKKSYVAYFEPEISEDVHPGQPRKYGQKIKLMETFDHSHIFSKVSCKIYGKEEIVSIASSDLLWKPIGSLIRFVFAHTSRGFIVLMCSDLTMNPVTALELYCTRIRIESMFDMLKNLIGAFCYRFWTKKMTSESRKPISNRKLKSPASENIFTIRRCWNACELFVMLGAIALGLLQLLSLKFTDSIWNQFDCFLRTRSRIIPSERTVRYVIANLLVSKVRNIAPNAILQEFKKVFQ